MKKNLLFAMSAVLLLMAGMVMTACSDDEVNGIVYKKEKPKVTRSELNVLEIQEVDGQTETCSIDNAICGIGERLYIDDYVDYPMKFTADIKNSLFFTGLYLGIENRENRKIEDLQVGESFGTTYIALENGKLDFSIWGDTYKAKRIGYSPGIYEVVDKRIDSDSVTYITISIQDLEIYLDDGNIHDPHK